MVTDLLLFLTYYCLTLKKKKKSNNNICLHGTYSLVVHCSVCTHTLLLLCSSGNNKMKAILPTQGQSTVSSAGNLS